MLLIKGLRVRGLTVPNIDPNDGGLNARALFLLETPGPMGVKFGFVSRDNPSPASRNMVSAFESAGLLRNQTLLWNVVPYYISTVDKNGKRNKRPGPRSRSRYAGIHRWTTPVAGCGILRQEGAASNGTLATPARRGFTLHLPSRLAILLPPPRRNTRDIPSSFAAVACLNGMSSHLPSSVLLVPHTSAKRQRMIGE
jgi:hypothetical protein